MDQRIDPRVFFEKGTLRGAPVQKSGKKLKDLAGVFADAAAFASENPEALIYEVQSFLPVPEGLAGGLFFGISTIYPGAVGGEYYMTRGHFHALKDRAEFYWGIEGEGALVLMGEDRAWTAERVRAGSLHYIPGHTAHRLVNTGNSPLVVGACWPSDAGHDYERIAREGFSVRLYEDGAGGIRYQQT